MGKKKHEYDRLDELTDLFHEYHREHPEVWEHFVFFTFEQIKRGFKHYGSKGIFERIRWHTSAPNADGEVECSLENNFHAFYARKFHKEYPEHKGFFRLAPQTSRGKPPKRANSVLW
jgi:hypothetical protein